MYNFFNTFSHSMHILASKKDEEFAMVDGVLKKGTWKTLPNHIHVFIVDGVIHAGPANTIGKSPDDLDWHQVKQEEDSSHPNPNPVRESVTNKYKNDLLLLSGIKRKDVRDKAFDKVMRKMAAEDDFHVIFLGKDNTSSPVLSQLAKDFASYGSFPDNGSFEDQIIFYNDRISLLQNLKKHVPPSAKDDVEKQMFAIKDAMQTLKNSGPAPGQSYRQNIVSDFDSNVTPVTPKPIKPKQPKVVPPQKTIRTKSKSGFTVESLLRGLFTFIIGSIALSVTKALKKSKNGVNKMLYSVTKHVLSNINLNERDNFFDVFLKTLGKL